MARWAGWGAGPAGSGATGGPSRLFLGAMLALALVAAGVSAGAQRWTSALLLALAALYFALRLFAGLGRRDP